MVCLSARTILSCADIRSVQLHYKSIPQNVICIGREIQVIAIKAAFSKCQVRTFMAYKTTGNKADILWR